MNEDILTWIGISLNFVAGLLLSPRLVGLKRLRRIEASIEDTIWKSPRYETLVAASGPLLRFGGIAFLLGLPVLYFGVAQLCRWGDYHFVSSLFLQAAVVHSIAICAFYVFFVGLVLLVIILEALIRSLEGNHRLISWLTSLGVLTFIVGNALLSWAMFHPGR
jgi:hypothetical protein